MAETLNKNVKINVEFDDTRSEAPKSGAPLDQIIGYLLNKVKSASGDVPQVKSFSIPTGDWKSLSSSRNGCNYYADISISGITAADTADIVYSFDNFDTLATASVSTGGETGSNKVTVYAVTAPTAALTGSIIIYKGGV